MAKSGILGTRFKRLVAFGLFLLLIVLAIQTWRFDSQQIIVPAVEPIGLPEREVLDRFAQALTIKTISESNPARVDPQAFEQFKIFLETSFPRVHEHLTRRTGDDFGDEQNQSLLFQWQADQWQGDDGGQQNAILLMGHYDVVPVEAESLGNWTHPPFAGDRDEQHVWGRGAIDNKAAAVGLLEAVEHLLEQGFTPGRTIYISLGHDEEVGGMRGNQPISQWMRREGIRLEYVLDEGGGIFKDFAGLDQPAAFIGIAEKGFATVRLNANVTDAGHASMPPPLGDTAIGILSDALQRLDQSPCPARMDGGIGLTLHYLGPEMSLMQRVALANQWLFSPLIIRQFGSTPLGNASLRTTIAPTLVEGGFKDNVLPTRATATLNLRVLPGDTVESTLAHIRSTIGDDRVMVEPPSLQREPSRLSSIESDAFQQLHRTIREIYPSVLVAPFVVVAGTDATHYDDDSLSRNVYRFVPWQLGKEDLKRIHGVDERLACEDYLSLVRFYERLIRNTATPVAR